MSRKIMLDKPACGHFSGYYAYFQDAYCGGHVSPI